MVKYKRCWVVYYALHVKRTDASFRYPSQQNEPLRTLEERHLIDWKHTQYPWCIKILNMQAVPPVHLMFVPAYVQHSPVWLVFVPKKKNKPRHLYQPGNYFNFGFDFTTVQDWSKSLIGNFNKLTSVFMSLSCYRSWISSQHCQRSLRIGDKQTTLTMICRNSWSITGQVQ